MFILSSVEAHDRRQIQCVVVLKAKQVHDFLEFNSVAGRNTLAY